MDNSLAIVARNSTIRRERQHRQTWLVFRSDGKGERGLSVSIAQHEVLGRGEVKVRLP